MAFHHVALATKDLEATHRFYTEAMGFTLVKVVVAPGEGPGAWSRHVFYDTGGNGMLAFWDLHDASIGDEYRTDLAKSLGLPTWVNHMAFDAATLDELEARKTRWREHGITVVEVDHGFCTSIYATDPNKIMVEFCCTTRPFSAAELDDAEGLLRAESPQVEPAPEPRIFPPLPATVSA